MNISDIDSIVKKQHDFFASGKTLSIDFRINALKKLRACILKYERDINIALKKDLGKGAFEGYMCETGFVLSEITFMLKNIRKFSKPEAVKTPLAQFPARSFKKPSPYGVVLIMSPWNYPFCLTLGPLVDAIAAGNTAIIKPSEFSMHSSVVLFRMISEFFDEEYITVIPGGQKVSQAVLDCKYDYIFYTGGERVGRIVMGKASQNLTPVTLELGGKSPCIVTKDANLKLAAKRIVFGKFLNLGQTCVAPDYIYCDEKIKDELIFEIKKQIRKQYGKNVFVNSEYGKIITEKHFNRLLKLMNKDKIVYGGASNIKTLQIEPTIMENVSKEDAVMQEEIFGPILPILTYRRLTEVTNYINSNSHPLALYVFTSHKRLANYLLTICRFGGGCVNDVIIHLATTEMGFGGFGESGMGAYHGKSGFDTFTHYKSIVDKKTWLDLPMRYQPYTKSTKALVRKFLK